MPIVQLDPSFAALARSQHWSDAYHPGHIRLWPTLCHHKPRQLKDGASTSWPYSPCCGGKSWVRKLGACIILLSTPVMPKMIADVASMKAPTAAFQTRSLRCVSTTIFRRRRSMILACRRCGCASERNAERGCQKLTKSKSSPCGSKCSRLVRRSGRCCIARALTFRRSDLVFASCLSSASFRAREHPGQGQSAAIAHGFVSHRGVKSTAIGRQLSMIDMESGGLGGQQTSCGWLARGGP